MQDPPLKKQFESGHIGLLLAQTLPPLRKKLKIDEKNDNSFISTSHTHATATSRSWHRHTKNMRQLQSAAGGAVVQNKQKSFLSMTDTAFNLEQCIGSGFNQWITCSFLDFGCPSMMFVCCGAFIIVLIFNGE